MKHNIKKLPKSGIEIEFELTAEEFSKYIDKALEHLKSHVKMDGFRKGQVPKEMVAKKLGDEAVLMEAGDLAVKESYAKYVIENNLEPVGKPEIQIKKIAKGNPFLFTAKFTVLPEIILPDYKKIVADIKAKEIAVDDKEIDEALNYLQRSRATFTDKTTGAEKKDYVKIEYSNKDINGGKVIKDIFILGEGGFLPDFEDNLLGMKKDDEKEFMAKFPENAPNNLAGKEGMFKVKMLAVQIMGLPEINDEFAKGLGAFDSLVALKTNMREGITAEKQESEKQRARAEMLGKVAEKVSVEVPDVLVEYEQDRLMDDMKNQIAHYGRTTWEDYLTSIKKTEEELKKESRKEAEKRIKDYLILRQLSKAEKIEVSKEELEEEMNKMVRHYSKEQADKIDIERLKEYSKDVIVNEKIFQILENYSKKQ